MERNEALKRTDHYRCRLCGQISPITEILCTKPGCRAQLGIYGELITPENTVIADNNPHTESDINSNTKKVQKNKKEEKHPQEKTPGTKHVVQAEMQAEGSYMTKRKFLIWIDAMFLLVYSGLAYCAGFTSLQRNETVVFACIAIMLVGTALAIVLAQKRKYVLHGIISTLNGACSFAAAGGILQPDSDTGFMFLVMAVVYGWLGVVSVIGTSRKRTEESGADAFLKKKTLMINLDIVILALCWVLTCFRVGLQYMLRTGRYRLYYEDCIVPCLFELAILIPSMILARREKYVWHGMLLCVAGLFSLLWALTTSQFIPSLLSALLIAVLYIWLGVISFLGERTHKAKANSGDGSGDILLWLCLAYLTCIPAGLVITIARIFHFYINDPVVVNKTTKILSIVGVIVGAVIYIYAVTHYSHCDEALYTSILGLLTKLAMGDL